jgi:NitT/TauT family transport system substrate-binding protein
MIRRLAAFSIALLMAIAPASAQTKFTFGTDWLAEAEHGGFYQALALGLYKKHGLDVTIKMGGPQTNGNAAIASGLVDAQLSSGSFAAVSMLQQGIPVVAVAALFQKDPQVLIAHPGSGADSLVAMKGRPIMISVAARNGYWLFLKSKFGFTDDQFRPYNFSMAPFLADKTAIMQGFVSSEPYQIERASGEKPVVTLLADSGFSNYSNVILMQSKMVATHPEVARSFVEASIEGWYSYMYGNPEPGNALIRAANKDMTQDLIDNGIKLMKAYGIVDSGDSLTGGLGTMTLARWQDFYNVMADAGLYKKGLDVSKAFTTQFVGRAHGMEMKPK